MQYNSAIKGNRIPTYLIGNTLGSAGSMHVRRATLFHVYMFKNLTVDILYRYLYRFFVLGIVQILQRILQFLLYCSNSSTSLHFKH